MAKEYLVEFHMERQEGKCAVCDKDLRDLDRWAIRVDRFPKRGEDGGTYTEDNTRLICLECDWDIEGNRPHSPRPLVRAAYDQYRVYNQAKGDFGRMQKAMSGQTANTSKSAYKDPAVLEEPRVWFEEKEKEAKNFLEKFIREQPEWKGFMKDAPGLGELTAAFLLSRLDMTIATTPSKVWKYFGFDPTEPYNPGKGKMRAPLYAALSIALIRQNSPYRADYDAYKEKGVSHGGAIRRLIKLWLSHLWATWRAYEGLPVRPPYAHRDGSDYKKAADYGWPEP